MNHAGERQDQRNDVSAETASLEQMAADVFFFLFHLRLCDNLRESFFFFLQVEQKKPLTPRAEVWRVLFCCARRSRAAKFLDTRVCQMPAL